MAISPSVAAPLRLREKSSLRTTGALPESVWIDEPNESDPQRQNDENSSQQHVDTPADPCTIEHR
jgi:hypothetical protein